MTQYYFRATDAFAPGTQKISVLTEPAVRRTLAFFAVYAVIMGPAFHFVNPDWQVVMDTVYALLFIMPFAIILAGGASAAAWALYAVFAVFAFAAAAPTFLGVSPLFLLAAIPAVGFFVAFHRRAPHVLEHLGYLDKTLWYRELAIILILSAVMNYICLSAADASGLFRKIPHNPYRIAALILICLTLYGPILGILFGIIFRRLLDYKFQPAAPIAIVSICIALYFLPAVLPRLAPFTAILSLCVMGSFLGTCLGLAYFFSKTTRVLLIFYVFYYLMYKIQGL